MAAGGKDILSLLSEDFLSCEVCQEHFDADARTPRILPCHHTFCGSCLRQLNQDGHLTCPKCRVSITVEGPFPTDTTRVQLLDLVKTRDQGGQVCQGCEGGAVAMTRCQECEEFLCVDCTRAHQTVKISRNHKLEVLSKAAQPTAVPKAKAIAKEPELCSQHQDEKLKWFCGKCTKTACSTCALTMHKGCPDVVELSSIVDEKKQKVLALCEKLSGLGKMFRQKAEQSKASSEAVDQRLQEGIQQAEQTFSDIVSTAMERQAQVIQELRTAAEADRLSLEGDSTTFRSLQAAAEASAERGRQVVSLELAASLVEQESEMEKTAADLGQKTTATVKPAPTYQIRTEQVDQVKSIIQSIGRNEAVAPVRKLSDRRHAERPKPPPEEEVSPPEVPPRVSVSVAPAPPTKRNTNCASLSRTELQDEEESRQRFTLTLAGSPRMPRSNNTSLMPTGAQSSDIRRANTIPQRSPSPSRPPRMPPPEQYLTMMPMAAKSAAILRGRGSSLTMGGTTFPKTAEAFLRDSMHDGQGVTCSVCRDGICESRYQCLQCPNFTICEGCEQRNAHPYHSFLKIPKPWRAGDGQKLVKIFTNLDPPRTQSSGQEHKGIDCDGCDDKMIGARFVCLECPDCDLCKKCERQQKHPPHNMLKLSAPWEKRNVKVFMEKFQDIVQV